MTPTRGPQRRAGTARGTVASVLVPAALAILLVAGVAWVGRAARLPEAGPARAAVRVVRPLPPGGRIVETAHYRIYSYAPPDSTSAVGAALEDLYAAYARRFPVAHGSRPMAVVLYRDRRQFKAFNRSAPWAEAYYREPRCHAYADGRANPYHWMLHEATHQLLRERSGYHPARWANEGLAAYFGAQRLHAGRLVAGTARTDAYPIWWLARLQLSGDVVRDGDAGHVVRLADLIESDGIDIGPRLNEYYVGWWSLVHFLLHGSHGRYAGAFRTLVAEDARRDGFERRIGPLPRIEREWYAYLQRASLDARRDELAQWPQR